MEKLKADIILQNLCSKALSLPCKSLQKHEVTAILQNKYFKCICQLTLFDCILYDHAMFTVTKQ